MIHSHNDRRDRSEAIGQHKRNDTARPQQNGDGVKNDLLLMNVLYVQALLKDAEDHVRVSSRDNTAVRMLFTGRQLIGGGTDHTDACGTDGSYR